MNNPFSSLKDVGQLMKIQRQLDSEEITVSEGDVEITMTATQKVKSVKVNGKEDLNLAKAISRAIQKSQELAVAKLQQAGGEFLPN